MEKNQFQNNLFLRACFGQPVNRTPVWMMRQAGRYLPEYRALRKKHDFITLYKTPELAAEITLQPVNLVGVDAAILFSDILVVPEAMGMKLQFLEGRGPVFQSPLRRQEQVDRLRPVKAESDLHFVMEAIRLCRPELKGRIPLIGFSGAPWTLATYMVEGQGSRNDVNIKQWRYGNPGLLHRLLEKVTAAVIDYLKAQVEAGAQAIQVFDSWAGILDPEGFREFAFPYSQRIFRELRKSGLPLIYFAKGAGVWLDTLLDSEAHVLGLDWTVDIGAVRRKVGGRFALQGNLDPTALFAPPEIIRKRVVHILEAYGPGNGHVFNLGHGILPNTPVAHARTFIEAVKEESVRFHG